MPIRSTMYWCNYVKIVSVPAVEDGTCIVKVTSVNGETSLYTVHYDGQMSVAEVVRINKAMACALHMCNTEKVMPIRL